LITILIPSTITIMSASQDDEAFALEKVTLPLPQLPLSSLTSTNAHPKRLKAALWYSIGRITDDETLKHNVNATPQFIGALMELVWAQIGTAATDLECFARHAGRNTIRVEDVLLLGRRNEGLKEVLEGVLNGEVGRRGG